MSLTKPKLIMSDTQTKMQEKKDKGSNKPNAKTKKMISKLLELCEKFDYFFNQDEQGYAVITDNKINKVMKIHSQEFKKYLNALFFRTYKIPITSTVLKEVVEVLEAKACFEGTKKPTYTRIANLENKIYVDLCNDGWQCVEIDAMGFRVLDNSPVMFERKRGMTSLPLPCSGGDIMKLREFINVHHEQFPLIIAWLLCALRGKPAYYILMIIGGQGSGKSTLAEILRKILDPSVVLLRGSTRDENDLIITSKSSFIVVMDNLSKISYTVADRLCQMSTGGGFTKRKLYSDCDEILLKLQNPVMLNGISFIPDRPDLLERSILIDLPPLTGKWGLKDKLMQEFDKCLPEILGALYTLISIALRELPITVLKKSQRLGESALFVSAAEKGLNWEEGTILKLLDKNQDELASQSVDNNIFANVLLDYIKQNKNFNGTAHELLNVVNQFVKRLDNKYDYVSASLDWPRAPQKVGQVLARIKPYLSRLGVKIEKSRSSDKHSRKMLHIFYEEEI